eukprot:403352497
MELDQLNQVSNINDEPQINPEGFFSDLTNNNACTVRVAVRVRPMVGRELYEGGAQKICVGVDQYTNKIQIGEKNFQFDRVFPLSCAQVDLFEVCGKNLVLGCFAGYNATILAYGQTGSGKTHTMGTGSTSGLLEEQIGIVPRVFQFIFDELDRRKRMSSFSEFAIKVSFLELYNEELHDLLDPVMVGNHASKSTKELLIKEKNGNIYVQGLKEEPVQSKEECLMLLNKGISHRTTSATLMNEGSSRSHAIFTVAIEQRIVKEFEIAPDAVEGGKEEAPAAGQQEELISAKFHFVDLAGSERIKKTGATGQLLKEGISINKGLLCLGNVISALTEEKSKNQHIPYRDSKLTRILQDSLGGNSRTTMIACVSPAESNYEETLNSIKYASRARNIKNKPVVNRDPNSMLIDSLRQQISSLTGEVKEYQNLLSSHNIKLPDDFQSKAQQRAAQNTTPSKTISSDQLGLQSGSINFQEVRDLKISMSRKEKELKDLKEQLQQALVKSNEKDQQIELLQQERDNLRLKNEIMSECLDKNNIKFQQPEDNKPSMSLIDEYKTKLQFMQKELDRREKELQDKNKLAGSLQLQIQTDSEVMRKHIEENQRLKRQLKKMEELQAQSPLKTPTAHQSTKLRINPQQTQNQSDTLKKQNTQLNDIALPDLNEKFISNLSNQLESMFQTGADDESMLHQDSQSNIPVEDDVQAADKNQVIQEKEKILETVKNHAKQMQNELMELMKNEYEKRIQEIEKEKQRVDTERQDKLKVSQADSKQQQVIDQQYKQKMEELNKQLVTFKDKEKKQEVVAKQVNVQMQKIKGLEEDLIKMKKKEEEIEKQRKNDSQKFSQLKQNLSKELNQAKKLASDKEKTLQKLKIDLKKVDQLAQKKMSELKGFQKKVMEERMKRDQEKKEEYESKGIDVERIKTWITENTNRMLDHRELTEQMEQQLEKKEQIEEEMLTEGEKLANLMIEKDRMEIEMQQSEVDDAPDEGKILELEELHYLKSIEVDQITEHLDSLDETLSFVNNKVNKLTEDISALDIDNIEPIKFSGLASVDAARVTLQTFFSVLLDLNIYNRDLEIKCIESDEAILGLNDQIRLLNSKMEEMSLNSQGQIGASNAGSDNINNRVQNQNKDKAIKNIVETLDGFVDYQDVKNLHLTPNEQNSLTKLSLSKILSHKLESALNDKEQLKLKLDNLKKKFKDDKIMTKPLGQTATQIEKPQEKELPEKKFSSLANARERRKQGGVGGHGPSSSVSSSLNQSNITNQTADSSDTGPDITIQSKPSGGTSNLHLKYKAKMQNSRPPSSFDVADQTNQPTRGRNVGLNSQNSQRNVPSFQKSSPKKSDSSQNLLQLNQPDTSFLKKQLLPITEYNGPTKKVPNFKDRRNRHKMERTDDSEKVESDNKVLEIDSIKEQTQQIGQNNAKERRQSRIREFKQRGFSNNRNRLQSNLNSNDSSSNYNRNDSNKALHDSKSKGNYSSNQLQSQGSNLDLGNGYEYTSEMMDSILSPSKGLRNKWSYEELAQIETHGQQLIGCDYAENKIIMVFQDFSIREIRIDTLEEISNFHVFMINNLNPTGEQVVDFCIDRDLNAIAIASDRTIYVFDFQDGYKLLTRIEVENISQVLFCNFNVIVLVKDESVAYVVSYQIGEDEPIEISSYQIQTQGYPAMIKTDNQNIFFSSGIRIGRLEMPDLSATFVVETEHSDVIINFSVSQYAIITTSRDSSIRCHSIDTGEQNQETLQEMECDHLETEGDFVLTRCGMGQVFLIWKYSPFKTELELLDEIAIEPLAEYNVLDFKMKGKILAKLGKVRYNLVLMVTCVDEGFMINTLKHKPLSEY